MRLFFHRVYEMADLVAATVKNEGAFVDGFFGELGWTLPAVRQCVNRFSKTSLLAHCCFTIIRRYHLRAYRKDPEAFDEDHIELTEEALQRYEIPFVPFRVFCSRRFLMEGYDFSGIGTLVDLGGGHGSFLSTILRTYPAIKGILAELPAVIDGARSHLKTAQLSNRSEVVPINFFESVPAGGDAYVMKRIIHDWDDERSTITLKNCHRAMAGRGKLLLVEMVIPSGNDPDFSKWLDIAMLVYSGGCERTEREYRDLLTAAGFRLTRITPTRSSASVIEAVPV